MISNPRIRVRTTAPVPDGARCVVCWMQRAQRGLDNPALNVAIGAGNALGPPVYGLIRYLSDTGAAREFDVPAYIERVGRAS